MRKPYTSLLLAALLPLTSVGQITIGQAEMPSPNDQVVRVRAATNPFLNYAATGAGHTWNFSSLSAMGSDTTKYRTVASTNFVYAVAYADLFFNPYRANQAKSGVDIPFSNFLPINNPYTFRYRSSSAYKTVGFGAEISGLPVPIMFSSADVIYQLPLQYGDSTFSHSAYDIEVPTVGGYAFRQDRVNQVDGWGAITTPAGTFDVLRVKTTLRATDEVMGVSIDRPVTREYKWLAQGLKTPVLQINTTSIFGAEVVSGVWYYDAPRTISVVQPLASVLCPGSAVNVYFEATGAFNAGGILIPANQFRAQLSDANGSFASPVTIGSLQSSHAGVIQATIPANTVPGNGYRIRVVSTSPSYTGSANTFNITVGGVPQAAISAHAPLQGCMGDTIALTAVGGPGYQWQLNGAEIAGATGDVLLATQPGQYTVQVSNACGTATSPALEVSMSEAPVFAVAQETLVSCALAPSWIRADQVSGGTATLQWLLNDAPIADATTDSVAVVLAGQYTLRATDPATGCSSLTAPVMAEVENMPAPTILAEGPATFCEGGELVLTADGQAGNGLQWTLDGAVLENAADAQLEVAVGGLYAVRAISANGCYSAFSGLEVTVLDRPATPGVEAHGPLAFCQGGELMLSTNSAAETYQWMVDGQPIDEAITPVLYVTGTGVYTLVTTDEEGCQSLASQAFDVVVEEAPATPVMDASGPLSFCEGGEVVLNAASAGAASFNWWMDGALLEGAHTGQLAVGAAGAYSVAANSAAGCESPVATAVVQVHPLPAAPVISLDTDGLLATGDGSFQWFLDGNIIPGATNAAIQFGAEGNYSVEFTDANGCSSISAPWLYLHTGMAHVTSAALRVYPNPSTGLFTAEWPGANNVAYQVMDMTGKTVATGKLLSPRNTIDLSGAPEGIYFVKFGTEGLPVLRLAVSK